MYTYAIVDVNNSSERGYKSFKETPLVIGNGLKYPATEWDLHRMNITELSKDEKSTSYTYRVQKGSTLAAVFVLPQNVTAERLDIPYLWNEGTEHLVVNLT